MWLLKKLVPSAIFTAAYVTRMGGKLLDEPGIGEVQVLYTRMP